MKIAVITSGVLPFPPLKGGAVENLIEFYIDHNECHSPFHDFTIYTLYDKLITESILNKYCHSSLKLIYISKFVQKFEYYKDLIFYKLFHISINNRYIEKVLSLINDAEFDLIIVENRPEFVLSISQKVNTKIVLHLHNDTLNSRTQNAYKILDACDSVWCVSRFVKDRVGEIYQSSKIKVLYNGIDIDQFAFQFFDFSLKSRLGFKEKDFVVVFSGRITKNKGIQELVEAFTMLKKNGNQNIKLLILGSAFYGTDWYRGSYFKKMDEYVSQYKKDICFTGFIDYNRIPEYLSIADISVVPSIWDEPFGLTVVESLSMGLPLIVSDGGGIPEIITSDCAIEVKRDVNFVENMAVKIKFLMENPEVRRKMSEAARQRSFLFSKDQYCSEFYRLLEEYQ